MPIKAEKEENKIKILNFMPWGTKSTERNSSSKTSLTLRPSKPPLVDERQFLGEQNCSLFSRRAHREQRGPKSKFFRYCVCGSHASRGYAKSRMDDTKNRLFSINWWTLNMIKIWIWKYFIEPLLRYANPDMPFLGTLKINFQIMKVFRVLMLNLIIIFIFRVAIQIQLLIKT